MAFYLYKECRLENLAGRFAAEVYDLPAAAPAGDDSAALLAGHTVIVHTRGMGEYLQQFLAEHSQIAANLQTIYLNSFINNLLGTLYGEKFYAALRRSNVQYMQREIMRRLCDKEFVQNQVPGLQKYVNGRNNPLKRWQLAGKIAGLFEDYQLFRAADPAKLFENDWDQSSWQKVLYYELFGEKTPGRDHFFRQFLTGKLTGEEIAKLPGELSVFGVGAMAPVFLDIFVRLAEYCRVNFFYLTVCDEYWEYQDSPRQVTCPAAWDTAEAGNPLLQTLGRQGRGFFSALMSHDVITGQLEADGFLAPDDYPAGSTMLEIMQYDIRHLFDRREVGENAASDLIGQVRHDLKNDNSIAIHNCHSLRRQLEVLHDELLKLIKSGVAPRDIIVMAPDINRCVPVIKSVFGSGALKDVYSIADVPPGDKMMALEVFRRALELASGRFEYSEVMAFMDLAMVSDLLKLPEGGMEHIARLLYDAGARWGFDGTTRQKFCKSDFPEFSWQHAIDRLLAGWANRQNSEIPVLPGGISSVEALEGGEIEAFARVVRMLENLAGLAAAVAKPATVSQWSEIFEKMLNDFFDNSNASATALTSLRGAVNELKIMAHDRCAPGLYPLNAAWEMLQDNLEDESVKGKFLRGRITFCRMTPMRSIPRKVVAVIDLNENTFPRRNNTVGFDLIAEAPLPGDRNLAVQDRYLLLEALLSARSNLLLFYQGQSPRDNQPMAPCAPLSEVAGYLSNAFGLTEFKHKVSGIDEVYYCSSSPCRSLAMDNYEALMVRRNSAEKVVRQDILPGVIQPLLLEGSISLDTLKSFFSCHSRFVARNQLGLYYQKDNEMTNDEIFELDNLGEWALNDLLVKMHLAERSDQQTLEYARRSNMLPPGSMGEKSFLQCAGKLPELPAEWKDILSTVERRPVSFKISADCCISGMVNMTPDGKNVIAYRWGGYDGRTALPAVLGTLLAAAGSGDMFAEVGAKMINLEHGEYVTRYIKPVSMQAAVVKLRELLAIASEPRDRVLALFEKSSALYKDMAAAGKKFCNAYYQYGDVFEPEVQAFFSKEDWKDPVFQEEFVFYAQKLYGDIEIGELSL